MEFITSIIIKPLPRRLQGDIQNNGYSTKYYNIKYKNKNENFWNFVNVFSITLVLFLIICTNKTGKHCCVHLSFLLVLWAGIQNSHSLCTQSKLLCKIIQHL